MALRFDAASGRLVQESDSEKELRLAEMRAQQERWNAMRLTPESDRRLMVGVATAKQVAASKNPNAAPLTDLEAQTAVKSGKLPARFNPANTGTGAGASVSSGNKYLAGMRAADAAEAEARRVAEEQRQRIGSSYEPAFTAGDENRRRQLQMLADAIAGGRGQISSATDELMQYLPQSTAFQDVPLTALQSEVNPLLAALQAQGAGTQEVESQRALSDALANQMRAMQQRSAEQYGQADQAYLDAIRRSAQQAGAAGQQYLSMQEPQLRSGIEQSYSDYLNQLRQSRAAEEANVANSLSDALQEIIKSRMEVAQTYTKPKNTRRRGTAAGQPSVPTLPDTRGL